MWEMWEWLNKHGSVPLLKDAVWIQNPKRLDACKGSQRECTHTFTLVISSVSRRMQSKYHSIYLVRNSTPGHDSDYKLLILLFPAPDAKSRPDGVDNSTQAVWWHHQNNNNVVNTATLWHCDCYFKCNGCTDQGSDQCNKSVSCASNLNGGVKICSI